MGWEILGIIPSSAPNPLMHVKCPHLTAPHMLYHPRCSSATCNFMRHEKWWLRSIRNSVRATYPVRQSPHPSVAAHANYLQAYCHHVNEIIQFECFFSINAKANNLKFEDFLASGKKYPSLRSACWEQTQLVQINVKC